MGEHNRRSFARRPVITNDKRFIPVRSSGIANRIQASISGRSSALPEHSSTTSRRTEGTLQQRSSTQSSDATLGEAERNSRRSSQAAVDEVERRSLRSSDAAVIEAERRTSKSSDAAVGEVERHLHKENEVPGTRDEPQKYTRPIDVESRIPVRQARPPTTAASGKRRQQPSPVTLASQPPAAVSGSPLAQPNYELDWLPEDEIWLNAQLISSYIDLDADRIKAKELQAAKESVAAGTSEHEVLQQMIEAGASDNVIERFLGKGYEEDEAEQRETEYFEKLERMIADEAEDIDLALTLSRLDIESHPRRESPLTLDFGRNARMRRQRQKFRKSLNDVHKGVEVLTILAEEDEPEEVQPELAAAMMYTEECGLGMTNPPTDMFAYLFKQQPVRADDQLEVVSPSGGLLTQDVGGRSVKEPERTSRRTSAESAFRAPAEQQPSAPLILQNERKSARSSVVSCGITEGETSERFNLVQMCGSFPPLWFRGYFEAFPYTLGKIGISRSPSITLQTAWYLVRPETFTLNKMMVLEGD